MDEADVISNNKRLIMAYLTTVSSPPSSHVDYVQNPVERTNSSAESECKFIGSYAKTSKWYIITGGPGVGKSTTLSFLKEKMGIAVVMEAATDLIKDDLKKGIKEPWAKEKFNSRVFKLQQKRQDLVKSSEKSVVFFDRAPMDVLTYEVSKTNPNSKLIEKIKSVVSEDLYQKTVFFLENLDKCKQTEVRAETLEESIQKGNDIVKMYRSLGYRLVRIPSATVEERANRIMNIVKLEQN